MLFLWTVYWGLAIKVMIIFTLGGIIFHCYSDHDIFGPVEAIGGVWTILLPSWSPIETIYFGKPGSACQRALVNQNPLTLIWLNGNWLYFAMYIYNDSIVDECYYINNWIYFFSIFTYRITFTFIEACCISISHNKKKTVITISDNVNSAIATQSIIIWCDFLLWTYQFSLQFTHGEHIKAWQWE